MSNISTYSESTISIVEYVGINEEKIFVNTSQIFILLVGYCIAFAKLAHPTATG